MSYMHQNVYTPMNKTEMESLELGFCTNKIFLIGVEIMYEKPLRWKFTFMGRGEKEPIVGYTDIHNGCQITPHTKYTEECIYMMNQFVGCVESL